MLLSIYKVFNYSSLFLVMIFIVLMLTETVPKEWYLPLVYIGFALLILRIVLRIYTNSYLKKLKEGEASSNNQNEQTDD